MSPPPGRPGRVLAGQHFQARACRRPGDGLREELGPEAVRFAIEEQEIAFVEQARNSEFVSSPLDYRVVNYARAAERSPTH